MKELKEPGASIEQVGFCLYSPSANIQVPITHAPCQHVHYVFVDKKVIQLLQEQPKKCIVYLICVSCTYNSKFNVTTASVCCPKQVQSKTVVSWNIQGLASVS